MAALQRCSAACSTSTQSSSPCSIVGSLSRSRMHTIVPRLPYSQSMPASSSTMAGARLQGIQRAPGIVCQSLDPKGDKGGLPNRINPVYLAIIGVYAGLFALKNPYIFAALSIATIIPQNSTVTSLNSLVIFFYESGLFMSFAEAVYCVRLITW
eukprot:CAMPEP_0202867688 /NCGR_PEP_ID=MMETSP1391-20130828/9571_1 /ASSEMBLY_ACC=CAM_ASM_000867 /TAXON_ID=1034604 /ORGANISM="Chlamydomonas leiostraca, Strain SAG 11-49" /LENGTH=153 /DNA_ID=CAMNT_0049547751 /DNA_START=11 /DNA_END=469 /DNA_ORIENTATION=-